MLTAKRRERELLFDPLATGFAQPRAPSGIAHELGQRFRQRDASPARDDEAGAFVLIDP